MMFVTQLDEVADASNSEERSNVTDSDLRRYSHLFPDCKVDLRIEVEEIDDYDVFAKWVNQGQSAKIEKVMRMYYNLACCSAYECLKLGEDKLAAKDRWLILATHLREFVTSYHLKASAREGCMRAFPELEFPDAFHQYVQAQHCSPTKAFLKKNPKFLTLDAKRQILLYTGYRVEERCKDCQEAINKLNFKWVDELPSRCSRAVLLAALRRSLWHDECLAGARQSVNARSTVITKTGEPSLKFTKDFTQVDAIEEAYLARMAKMSDECYPFFWVAFLVMGKPAGDCMSPLFNCGLQAKSFSVALGGRAARQKHHRSISEKADSTPLSKRARSSSHSSTPSFSKESDLIRNRQLLQAEVQLLSDMGEVDELRVVQRQLLKALREERASLSTLRAASNTESLLSNSVEEL